MSGFSFLTIILFVVRVWGSIYFYRHRLIGHNCSRVRVDQNDLNTVFFIARQAWVPASQTPRLSDNFSGGADYKTFFMFLVRHCFSPKLACESVDKNDVSRGPEVASDELHEKPGILVIIP
jgi:hypothetical protein